MKLVFSVILVLITFNIFSYDLKKIEKESEKRLFNGNGRFHHPVRIPPKSKIALPLVRNKMIGCITCHSEHIKTKTKKYLLKDYRKLCVECHIEKNDGNMNHLDLAKKKSSPTKMVDAMNCSACHFMHNSKDKNLLRVKGHKLCITCHTNKNKFHRKHLTLPQIAKINGFELEDKKITCLNCHKVHGANRAQNYLKDRRSITKLCSNCHGKKASYLLQEFHKKHR